MRNNFTSLTDIKQKADIFWNDAYECIPFVDVIFVINAMENCNRADRAVLDQEHREKERELGPFTHFNPKWKEVLEDLIRESRFLNDSTNGSDV